MQTITKDLVTFSKILILGLILGLGVSYAQATWNAPQCQPPECNTPAPLNVGTAEQTKLGAVTLNANTTPFEWGLRVFGKSWFEGETHFKGKIKIEGGEPGLNKVLTSDASGLASWKEVASATNRTVTIAEAGLMGSGSNVSFDIGTNWDVLYFNGAATASDASPASAILYRNNESTPSILQGFIVTGTGLTHRLGGITTSKTCNTSDTAYQLCFNLVTLSNGSTGLHIETGTLIKGYFVALKY